MSVGNCRSYRCKGRLIAHSPSNHQRLFMLSQNPFTNCFGRCNLSCSSKESSWYDILLSICESSCVSSWIHYSTYSTCLCMIWNCDLSYNVLRTLDLQNNSSIFAQLWSFDSLYLEVTCVEYIVNAFPLMRALEPPGIFSWVAKLMMQHCL